MKTEEKKWVNSDFYLEVSPVYTSCLSSPLLDPPRLGLYILASPDQAITLVWAWFQTVPECSACIQVQLCLNTSPAYHTWVYILNRPGQAIIEFGDWVCKCIWIVYTDVVNETVLTKLSMSSVIGCSNTSNHLLAQTLIISTLKTNNLYSLIICSQRSYQTLKTTNLYQPTQWICTQHRQHKWRCQTLTVKDSLNHLNLFGMRWILF